MRVPGIIGLAAGIVILGALALTLPIGGQDDTAEPAPAPRPGGSEPAPPEGPARDALPVEVLQVLPRRLAERLATTGTLRANEQVDLVSEITGVVERIRFREGTRVRRGEVLIEIDDAELQAQRDRVRHRLRLAEIREERQRQLREQGVTSEQEYDIAFNEMNVMRAELRLVEAQLEKTAIRAPFDGVIGLRYVSAGSLLTPQTRIATMQDIDPVKIDFTLPEKYAAMIAPGSRVEFRVRGTERRHSAEVYAVEPRIDPETRSLLIRARTPNRNGALLPGAFADVSLTVGEVADALVVPSLAIIPELGGKKVFIVENGVARPRRVETGIRTDTEVQITSGLSPGDRVIVSAIQRLRPDLPVRALPAGRGAADGTAGP